VSPLNQPAAQAIQATSQPPVEATEQLTTSLSIIAPLISPNLDLFAGPVAVPLELRIPSVHIAAPVLAVGLTPKNVMDAPTGRLNDPVWQKAFWYRGSGLPGDSGTATFAGHIDDGRGRPAVFAHLMDLQPGDLIIIRDLRTNLDINFTVISTTIYSRQQSSDPQILAQIYGAGPVAGDRPQPAADGLSHLTLITCAGDFIGGSFDHRLVVYATRSN
jgi:sortase (surface protein transpeptidase)